MERPKTQLVDRLALSVTSGKLSLEAACVMMYDGSLKPEKLTEADRLVYDRMEHLKNLGVSTWREHRQKLMHSLSQNHGYTDRRLSQLFKLGENYVKTLVSGFNEEKVFNPTFFAYERSQETKKSAIKNTVQKLYDDGVGSLTISRV